MKKVIIPLIIVVIASFGCKKESNVEKEVYVVKKYAKYRVAVYKDIEMKNWLATLEKGEDVIILGEEKYIDNKGNEIDVSKVKLADDSVGFVPSKHLAGDPIVFTEDTRAFARPTEGSSVYGIIPKGEIGFIIGEKANWVQVYVGEINGKYFTQQWVNGGYSKDPAILLEAKEYFAALNGLKDKDPNKVKEAKLQLEKLSERDSFIAEKAKEKLVTLDKQKEDNKEEN